MDWFSAPDYWLTRLVFQRALALVYLLAFVNALNQFRPLLGERGLLPVHRYLRSVSFREAPSLFHLGYSDRRLLAVAWAGIALSGAALAGLSELGPVALSMAAWLLLWGLYLSIVNVGQVFYGFGWESLLLEAGFLAAFLGPSRTAPPVLVLWLCRWLLFRVEFGAGLIKMRGDRCWRDLTCLDYHHETQPMPNGLSWYFHHLPAPLHRAEVLGNHLAQLVVPFGLFLPQPGAGAAALLIIATQLWLVLSGNFSWLNLITIALAITAVDGSWLHRVLPVAPPGDLAAPPLWYEALVLALALSVAVMSWWPVRNMASRRQAMNASFNRVHLVNTYGAFGSVTRVRREVVIEGCEDPGAGQPAWREYRFRGKPTDPRRRPPQVAPYHLRLDWLMWFAALSPSYAQSWFGPLLVRLLEGDAPTARLLAACPFGDRPPGQVRALLYEYRFTSRAQRRQTGAWWARELIGEYFPPVALRQAAAAEPGPEGLGPRLRPGLRRSGPGGGR